MPKANKYSKADIVRAAFELVREQGPAALSARAVAEALGASTMPVYSRFSSMDRLRQALLKDAFSLMFISQTADFGPDPYLSMGAGYVAFAKKEPHLFRLITEAMGEEGMRHLYEEHTARLLDRLRGYPAIKGLDRAGARQFFTQGLVYCHGLAMLAHTADFSGMDEDQLVQQVLFTGARYVEGFTRMRQDAPHP